MWIDDRKVRIGEWGLKTIRIREKVTEVSCALPCLSTIRNAREATASHGY